MNSFKYELRLWKLVGSWSCNSISKFWGLNYREGWTLWSPYPFLATFGCSWTRLKALIDSFKEELRSWKLVEYWSCNSISEFWCFKHREGCREHFEVYTHFWPHLDVLGLFWKLELIALRANLNHKNWLNIGRAIQFRSFGAWCWAPPDWDGSERDRQQRWRVNPVESGPSTGFTCHRRWRSLSDPS